MNIFHILVLDIDTQNIHMTYTYTHMQAQTRSITHQTPAPWAAAVIRLGHEE